MNFIKTLKMSYIIHFIIYIVYFFKEILYIISNCFLILLIFFKKIHEHKQKLERTKNVFFFLIRNKLNTPLVNVFQKINAKK